MKYAMHCSVNLNGSFALSTFISSLTCNGFPLITFRRQCKRHKAKMISFNIYAYDKHSKIKSLWTQ